MRSRSVNGTCGNEEADTEKPINGFLQRGREFAHHPEGEAAEAARKRAHEKQDDGGKEGAGNNATAAYCPLTRRAVLLLALRAAAVGRAAPGDHLQRGRSRRPGRPLRPSWDLAGREVNGTERAIPHLRRVDCIVLQLAVGWWRPALTGPVAPLRRFGQCPLTGARRPARSHTTVTSSPGS